MNKATKIKDLESDKGTQALYKLDVPLKGHHYVMVSAVDLVDPLVHLMDSFMGKEAADCETLIFPANEDGEVMSWLDLDGISHVKDHSVALGKAGYDINTNPGSSPRAT